MMRSRGWLSFVGATAFLFPLDLHFRYPNPCPRFWQSPNCIRQASFFTEKNHTANLAGQKSWPAVDGVEEEVSRCRPRRSLPQLRHLLLIGSIWTGLIGPGTNEKDGGGWNWWRGLKRKKEKMKREWIRIEIWEVETRVISVARDARGPTAGRERGEWS